MDLSGTVAFFLVMIALAATPSASVALVVTRSMTHGVPSGLAVAGGIVLGDLVFVALALFGMSILAEVLGPLFSVLRFAAAGYLIWLGLTLLRSGASPQPPVQRNRGTGSLFASAAAGLVLTLGDVKAILFYASLFPNLFNLADLSATDAALIVAVTLLTVGGVKAAYALAAHRVAARLRGATGHRYARGAAGGVLTATGAYLIARG